jgi:ubiquinone/menaquinone biosynthesis C-methylase UbiE
LTSAEGSPTASAQRSQERQDRLIWYNLRGTHLKPSGIPGEPPVGASLTMQDMNENHATLCGSPEWAEHIQVNILPALVAGLDLGDEMLEIGPGPGAATDWLRTKVRRLVALEVDADAALALSERLAGTNVEIVSGDASALEYADGSFDSVACFTMLHHVPTVSLQNRLLAEALRVLRPGAALIGADSLASDDLHHFHVDDTYNPVEVGSFIPRLQTIGFEKITLVVDGMMSFIAHKPVDEPAPAR